MRSRHDSAPHITNISVMRTVVVLKQNCDEKGCGITHFSEPYLGRNQFVARRCRGKARTLQGDRLLTAYLGDQRF